MYGFIPAVLVLSVTILTASTQLTNIAGSTSVSLSPTDATCGLTSTDSYCQRHTFTPAIATDGARSKCVFHACRTVCEEDGPAYSRLLRRVSGFNYDGSVTNTSKDFDGSDVIVAVFNRTTRLAFLRGRVNMTAAREFTLTFWIKPDNMETVSSVVDIHGAGHGERMFNVRLGSDLGVTVVSGTINVTRQTWTIPRHAWSHVAIQFQQSRVKVFLNGSDESATSAALQLHDAGDMSHLNLKIGQTFAGDITETHLVEEKLPFNQDFCRGRSDGWVDYTEDKVRVQCVDGTVSTVEDNRRAFSCDITSLTDLPPSDADFCRDKIDGWYRQHQSAYTRCLDGLQMNLHNCRGIYISAGGWGSISKLEQCKFCSSSCSCELDCADDSTNQPVGCDALSFICRDGEQMAHPKYCDEYHFCVRGQYEHRKCVYPDRWSVEHGHCERFQSVSCGERIPKNHPCDREATSSTGPGEPACVLDKHPANCTGQRDGLYYKQFEKDVCAVYGCINETLATLEGDLKTFYLSDNQRSTYFMCPPPRGIDPATGRCVDGRDCPADSVGYIPDSPYLRCTNDDVSSYRYDCRKYWRCEDGLWMVSRCPEGLMWSAVKKQCLSNTTHCGDRWFPKTIDTKARQFLGQLANIRLYDVALSESEIQELNGRNCSTWASDAHPIDYAVDLNSSSFWLSRAHLDSVDLEFDLRGTYKVRITSRPCKSHTKHKHYCDYFKV